MKKHTQDSDGLIGFYVDKETNEVMALPKDLNQKENEIPFDEYGRFLTITKDVLALHDTMLKAFPDKDDDEDLKVAIMAGLTSAIAPYVKKIAKLEKELKKQKA